MSEVITPRLFLRYELKLAAAGTCYSPVGHVLSPFSSPTDGTLRHWVCFPKPQRAIAAIQGKPSLHWHSFEHASHTTSHGPEQKNVDFSQSFYSSMAGLDLIGSGLLYLLSLLFLYNSLFSRSIWSFKRVSCCPVLGKDEWGVYFQTTAYLYWKSSPQSRERATLKIAKLFCQERT